MIEHDVALVLAGLFVGFIVGLTGMGGGALMTPVLVIVFGVQPLTAVSSDLLVSLIMKPVGGAVHLRRRTVSLPVVGWLVVGSVPSAFAGVLILKALGDGELVQAVIKVSLGAALVLAATMLLAKGQVQQQVTRRGSPAKVAGPPSAGAQALVPRPLATLVVGAISGLVVGMTSVGSGSLIIVCLMLLYPNLRGPELVGTDLVQAVPMVGAATLAHFMFGDVRLDLAGYLLLGAVPAVYAGARVSSRAPETLLRRALMLVLLVTGLKLLTVPDAGLAFVLVACLIGGGLKWRLSRQQVS